MAITLHVDIVSAEREIFSGRCDMVVASGVWGELGIAPGHMQMLTKLQPGQIRLNLADGGEELFYISGGFLEVQPTMVTVLADTAERAADLDAAQAEESMRLAQEMLQDKQQELDYAKALSEAARAAAQLKVIRQLRARMK